MNWRAALRRRHAIDLDRAEEAIRDAESRTSGEIVVSVSRPFWGDVRRVAERAFTRLGVHRTKARNGVLIFVVPSRRRFVVLGDAGIHERVGDAFWQEVAGVIAAHGREGDMDSGLIAGIRLVGERLALHFPRQPDDVNELPDRVDEGGDDP